MNKLIVAFLIAVVSCCGLFCSLEKPTAIDGTLNLKIIAIDTTGTLPRDENSKFARVPRARVRIKSTDYNFSSELFTDEHGELVIKDLLVSHYQISVDREILFEHLSDLSKIMLNGSLKTNVSLENNCKTDTIKMNVNVISNIIINEIYYSGVTINGSPYNSDQFIELYNSSNKTLYLDGLILARMSKNLNYIGTDFVESVYAYQFSGEGYNCPIMPKELIVVAQDALDHRKFAPKSIDLSNADYEFFNPFNDIDNPLVTNLDPINPNNKTDFMIDTKLDCILLIKIKDNKDIIYNSKGYMLFKISDVIDGVKYAHRHDVDKHIDPRIDAGFAGYGISRFCGKSIERHHPETAGPGYDTNNSIFDFVTLNRPTPGYQHSTEDVIPPLF